MNFKFAAIRGINFFFAKLIENHTHIPSAATLRGNLQNIHPSKINHYTVLPLLKTKNKKESPDSSAGTHNLLCYTCIILTYMYVLKFTHGKHNILQLYM